MEGTRNGSAEWPQAGSLIGVGIHTHRFWEVSGRQTHLLGGFTGEVAGLKGHTLSGQFQNRVWHFLNPSEDISLGWSAIEVKLLKF